MSHRPCCLLGVFAPCTSPYNVCASPSVPFRDINSDSVLNADKEPDMYLTNILITLWKSIRELASSSSHPKSGIESWESMNTPCDVLYMKTMMTDAYIGVQDNKIPLRLVTFQSSSTYRPYFSGPLGCDFSNFITYRHYPDVVFWIHYFFGKLVASDKITWGTWGRR